MYSIVAAGIIKNSKHLSTLRKAIDEIKLLLLQTCKLNTKVLNFDNCAFKASKMNENIPNENQLFNNNLAQEENKEFAYQLARLLAAQGKSEIDPAQLKKIICICLLKIKSTSL